MVIADNPMNGYFTPESFGASWTKNAQAEAAGVGRLLEISKNAHILDAGCGVGRHARIWADQGFFVLGVDAEASLLKVARRDSQNYRAQFVVADLHDFHTAGRTDAVVAMYDGGFGYRNSPQADAKLLGRFFEWLAPGGSLLLHVLNAEYFENRGHFKTWQWQGGSITLTEFSWNNDERVLNEAGHTLIEGQVIPTPPRTRKIASIHLYTGAELLTMAQGVGFEDARISDAACLVGGQFVSPSEPREIVLLAQKPE